MKLPNLSRHLLFKKVTIAKWQLHLFGCIFFVLGAAASFWSTYFTIIPYVSAAGDTSTSWDFSVPGNYTLSDSTVIEVSGSTARLKLQEYASDANTALLLPLNESSGTTVDDTSSNNTDGTAGVASWVSGQLNNAYSFDGLNDYIQVPNSTALGFSQSHSIEAWVKLDKAMAAESHANRQTIVDKGDYQLYFDNETGKLAYEMASTTTPTWNQVAGDELNNSWSFATHDIVQSVINIGSTIYVGLGNEVGDAEIWAYASGAWSMVGGDGVNSSWANSTYEEVIDMAVNGSTLYVGLGNTAGEAEVWSYSGSTWTKIGDSDTLTTNLERVYSLEVYNDGGGNDLYVGTGSSTDDGRVYMWNGSTWTQIGGMGASAGYSSWGNADDIEAVHTLHAIGTNLYAGLGTSTDDGEVWRFNGTTWTRIAGNGAAAGFTSWGNADDIESVFSFASDTDYLYAGLGVSGGDGDVWRFNLTSQTWTQIGGGGLNSSWSGVTHEGVYSLETASGNLYAGLGNSDDDGEVWRFNGTTWTQIGGDDLNSGWTNAMNTRIVYDLHAVSGTIYAGIYNSADNGALWSFNGSSWTLVGGQNYAGSWGFYGIDRVSSLTTSGGKLYAGLGATAGRAVVWEYDNSTWRIIGGQGYNSSWSSATYEITQAMIDYGGTLYVGLGSSTDDGEVWSWNGSTWSQVGGDGLNSGWTNGDDAEYAYTFASSPSYLYVGIGIGATETEVWRWQGTTWGKIGGDGINSGWNAGYNGVSALLASNGLVYAGLGSGDGDSDIWQWNGSAWSQIGGDGLNSSWSGNQDSIESLVMYRGDLYAGLGDTAGEAEVWRYRGGSWTQVGGDGVNSSWIDTVYERAKSMAVYNGYLFASLGVSAGEAEIWRYDGSIWTQVGGDTLNSGWASVEEEAYNLVVYKGKLYVGLGDTANVDADIWAYGDNAILQSAATSFNTSWHHIAATYNGTTMKLYVDGAQDANTVSVAQFVNDANHPLYIGANQGSVSMQEDSGWFEGDVDQVRLSDTARSSFTTAPYSASAQTVRPATAVMTSGIKNWENFNVTETLNGGTATYRLSSDGGTTWKYWDGDSWETSSSTAQANAASVVNTNISSFTARSGGIMWQAILDGDGTQQVKLNSVEVTATSDSTAPTSASSLTSLSASGGSSITTNTWYSYSGPYFSWTAGTDTGGSGVEGYYVYFGTDNSAVPSTAGTLQSAITYTASGLTSGQTYYLRIQTKDYAGNVSSTWAPFIYKYDGTNPTNPGVVSVSPSGYTATNSYTFLWPTTGGAAGSDSNSGIAGYQYKTGASSGTYSDWSTTTTDSSVTLATAAYQEGANVFYLRTIDNAGNISSSTVQVNYYFAGNAPTAPTNLAVTPSTNTSNSFAFSWSAPSTYTGLASDITYCYTVNTLPSSNTCTFTSAGVTSLTADSYANQPGQNTFYIVARDGTNNISYGAYASVTFTANTSAPGIPQNAEIADVSVKSTSSWKLAVSWEAPSDTGSGVSSYKIYRSTDGSTYSLAASTSGISYVDTSLSQQTYYYKIKACDSASNCGAFTAAVSLYPDGKYTTAADLTAGPTISSITTKKATISWSTGRKSDSRIAYGTSAGDYFDEEVSSSTQTTDHSLTLTNLAAGTSYYFVTKWTDEDGNLGTSSEKTFKTDPAPSVKNVTTSNISLDSAIITFTSTGASSVKIVYGETTSFGGLKTVTTATSESTYSSQLIGLKDGTKYFYKIDTVDSESEVYEGTILNFETLPRPRIADVRIQQVKGTAQPTILVTWTTNTQVSSIVTYYPTANPSEAKDEVNVALTDGTHRIILRGLSTNTPYTLLVKGRDVVGNEATSDAQRFTTSTDTRPPSIVDMKVEGTVQQTASGQEQTAQLVVSWNTDEPATSQVEFGEGTGTSYSQKTQEDKNETYNHVVVISNLSPSKVYHLRALSKDSGGNEGVSIDTVTITPKATDNALDLVISNLSEVFGFLR